MDQMGVRFDRLRYEVFQNLILSPINTGSVRPALVATTPTACGIETQLDTGVYIIYLFDLLQQHLPLAVLKLQASQQRHDFFESLLQQHLPLAVLKQYRDSLSPFVAFPGCNNTYRLRY